LLRYEFASKKLDIIAEDFCFNNGIQLRADEKTILMSETARSRVLIVDLETGKTLKTIRLPSKYSIEFSLGPFIKDVELIREYPVRTFCEQREFLGSGHPNFCCKSFRFFGQVGGGQIFVILCRRFL